MQVIFNDQVSSRNEEVTELIRKPFDVGTYVIMHMALAENLGCLGVESSLG